jgi:CRP-like cAMP-binding protein
MDQVTAFSQYRQRLNQLVIFNDEEWDIFQQELKFELLKKGECYTAADTVCNKVSLIVSGSVRFYHIRDGAEVTGYFCLESDFISSYKSFITQQPGHTNITTLEDTELVTFTKAGLQRVMDNPVTAFKIERFGRLMAEYLICCYEDRILSFVTQTPEERYRVLAEHNKSFLQRIAQHHIANYLGITPVSLSRIRKRILQD